MPPDAPVPMPKGASRSRVYWEAQQRLGAEADRDWPRLLRSLLQQHPELERLDPVDRAREPGAPTYREQSGDEVVLRMRGSVDGTRHVWRLIALGALVPLVGLWFADQVARALQIAIVTSWLLFSGTYLAVRRHRRDEVRISRSKLRVFRRGQVTLDLPRQAVAYVETRAVEDDAVVDAVRRAERLVALGKPVEPRQVCVHTVDGESFPIGGALDRVAADALCAAIEDELGLLPQHDGLHDGPRVRVASDGSERTAEEDALVHEAPEPRRSVDAEETPAA